MHKICTRQNAASLIALSTFFFSGCDGNPQQPDRSAKDNIHELSIVPKEIDFSSLKATVDEIYRVQRANKAALGKSFRDPKQGDELVNKFVNDLTAIMRSANLKVPSTEHGFHHFTHNLQGHFLEAGYFVEILDKQDTSISISVYKLEDTTPFSYKGVKIPLIDNPDRSPIPVYYARPIIKHLEENDEGRHGLTIDYINVREPIIMLFPNEFQSASLVFNLSIDVVEEITRINEAAHAAYSRKKNTIGKEGLMNDEEQTTYEGHSELTVLENHPQAAIYILEGNSWLYYFSTQGEEIVLPGYDSNIRRSLAVFNEFTIHDVFAVTPEEAKYYIQTSRNPLGLGELSARLRTDIPFSNMVTQRLIYAYKSSLGDKVNSALGQTGK